jgi:hypothetical protein
MNNLDAAIKSLRGSLHDIVTQQRALAKEYARVDRALSMLTAERPVGAITGTDHKTKDFPTQDEAARRRAAALYLDERGAPFTGQQMVEAIGEPQLLREYQSLIARMARYGDRITRVSPDGTKPYVYQRKDDDAQS